MRGFLIILRSLCAVVRDKPEFHLAGLRLELNRAGFRVPLSPVTDRGNGCIAAVPRAGLVGGVSRSKGRLEFVGFTFHLIHGDGVLVIRPRLDYLASTVHHGGGDACNIKQRVHRDGLCHAVYSDPAGSTRRSRVDLELHCDGLLLGGGGDSVGVRCEGEAVVHSVFAHGDSMSHGGTVVHGDEQLHQRIFIIGVKVLIGLILLRGDGEMKRTVGICNA